MCGCVEGKLTAAQRIGGQKRKTTMITHPTINSKIATVYLCQANSCALLSGGGKMEKVFSMGQQTTLTITITTATIAIAIASTTT